MWRHVHSVNRQNWNITFRPQDSYDYVYKMMFSSLRLSQLGLITENSVRRNFVNSVIPWFSAITGHVCSWNHSDNLVRLTSATRNSVFYGLSSIGFVKNLIRSIMQLWRFILFHVSFIWNKIKSVLVGCTFSPKTAELLLDFRCSWATVWFASNHKLLLREHVLTNKLQTTFHRSHKYTNLMEKL